MLLGPLAARDLAVGDVAHEEMAEGVLGLAFHGAPPLSPDELPVLEVVQLLLHAPALSSRDRGDGPEPEDLPEHGGGLHERLRLGSEQVEPRSDDALDTLGHRSVVDRPALAEQSRELLGVERVPTCTGEHGGLRLGGQHGALEKRVHQPGSLLVGERRERDRDRVRLPSAPPGAPCE